MNKEELQKLIKIDLYKKCKELNINKYLNKNKTELINIILIKLNEKDNISYIKPIIKWVGGKTQIINKIIDYFPKEMNNYHELFLGGGSVLLALLQNIEINNIKVIGLINAYDINETLIHFYKNIQNNLEKVIYEIKKIINIYLNLDESNTLVNRHATNIDEATTSQESFYYWIRHNFNLQNQEEKNTPLGTAYFIFLNKTCFRGVYREGPHGFNVPFGHYKNPEIINDNHLLMISMLIKNVNFYCTSFEKSFEKINENDFIYLDPPYAPENSKSFVSYTASGFTLEQHNLLFSLCKKFNFLMSNSDVDLVKDNFINIDEEKYKIEIILCKRSINSKNPESKTNELLIKSK